MFRNPKSPKSPSPVDRWRRGTRTSRCRWPSTPHGTCCSMGWSLIAAWTRSTSCSSGKWTSATSAGLRGVLPPETCSTLRITTNTLNPVGKSLSCIQQKACTVLSKCHAALCVTVEG
eukprot:8690697-Pyramimonas_sp.AAC.2